MHSDSPGPDCRFGGFSPIGAGHACGTRETIEAGDRGSRPEFTLEIEYFQPRKVDRLRIFWLLLSHFLKRAAYVGRLEGQVLYESKMTEQMRPRVKYVIGPDGSPLTIADLPPRNTKRWVIRRKAEVVAAVRGGLLSLEEACARYTLTVEEFLSWQQSIDAHGLAGLRTTRIQQYRA